MNTLAGSNSAIRALAFSPDGKTLASAGADRVATLWDLASRTPIVVFEGHKGSIRALAFSPDGKQLATAGEDGEVKLWDPKYWSRAGHALPATPTWCSRLAFTPSGATLASGGLDSAVKLWDTKTGSGAGPPDRPCRGRRGPGLRPGRPPARLDRLRRHRQALGARRADALRRRHPRLPR